jgi:D-alanine-D-alanine ligase
LDQLNERASWLLRRYGAPVMVERFIRGRELNIGLIEAPELHALPISEVLFVDEDPEYWPIVTYDAKWKPGSRDYESTPPRYPAKVSRGLAQRLEKLAKQAFRLLGCRDYARVDFRVQPSGKPFLLEVNPNPDFSPTAGLAGGLASAGLTHAQFTADLVWAAFARRKDDGEDNAQTNGTTKRRTKADWVAMSSPKSSFSRMPHDDKSTSH